MSAYRGGAVDVWNKAVQAMETVECPVCGEQVTVEETARHQHIQDCEKRQRHILDMTRDEARLCIDTIHTHIRHARALVLELYERKGWQALGYNSWRDCVAAEFQHSQTHMYRQLAAAFVEQIVAPDSPIGEIPESHLRPLAGLTAGEVRLIWDVMKDTSPDGKVTGAHAKSVASVLKEINQTGAIDDGTGNAIPVQQATLEHLKAAITEETFERMQRQREHIQQNSKRKTKLLHTLEFDALSEIDAAETRRTLEKLRGKHLQIVIREVEEE